MMATLVGITICCLGNQDHSDEAMRRLMFDMDPDSKDKGPMYFGDAGMYTDEVNHVKYPEEVRFPQSYLAFCVDREETEDEDKNYVTWGVRAKAHWEHVKWARIAKRTFEDDPDREAGILWNRSVLSPSKCRVIGNMFCIRSYTKASAIHLGYFYVLLRKIGSDEAVAGRKEGALRLLEEDPYRKSGLFGTVSLYRYPYNMGGGFNWHLSNFPYLALCMDKKGKAKLREKNNDAHLEYYEKTRRRCIGEGPILSSDLAEDSPRNKPVGSLMFFNAINDEEARETAEGDPFNQAGLYDSVFVARFNEIDLSGIGLVRANRIDPMRDMMAQEGLDRECEYPVKFGKYDLFENMKWLKTEVEKKQEQQYMEHRLKLYQQRCVGGGAVVTSADDTPRWYDGMPSYGGRNVRAGTAVKAPVSAAVEGFSDVWLKAAHTVVVARDRRIEREEVNEGALFRPGVYVYMGKRTETEWYDYWPTKAGPDADAAGEEFYTMDACYPPVDHFEDDLD
ncbi:unnamed protein product [Ectocarpus sp. CCAP 1310/34]|nr:unnamed protein product [Ectocarpus sp. CCAP 1310/34]